MIQLASGILGAAAAALAFSTMPLDLSARSNLQAASLQVQPQAQSEAQSKAPLVMPQVTRAAKGDRLASPSVIGAMGHVTLSVGLPGSADSSVVMRIVLPKTGTSEKAQEPKERASSSKKRVACEPAVSVLAPAAKLMQPARCVT
ncbi:hypothetical protein [Afipia carboxidovorans]|uniref:hypothetical protein n=1 Tax=Afipia carboxidovorans TaxID=40137 RepID=UPI0030910E36|nr:hypothetical protein CRBSH125_23920 [Afipia carboxidovorans]